MTEILHESGYKFSVESGENATGSGTGIWVIDITTTPNVIIAVHLPHIDGPPEEDWAEDAIRRYLSLPT